MSNPRLSQLQKELTAHSNKAQTHWDCMEELGVICEEQPRLLTQYTPTLVNILEELFSENWVKHQYLQPLAVLQLKLKYELGNRTGSSDFSELAQNLASDELFLAVLEKSFITDQEFESFLIALRRWLLLAYVPKGLLAYQLRLAIALAVHAFNNEYIFEENNAETSLIEGVSAEIFLQKGDCDSQTDLEGFIVCAMYQSVSNTPLAAKIATDLLLTDFEPLKRAMVRLISEPLQEVEIKSDLISFGQIADQDSIQVQSHYEENPFPRWLSQGRPYPSLENRLAVVLGTEPTACLGLEPNQRILVAGCGTGQQTLGIARGDPQAEIVSVDISRASLAYAQRMTDRYSISNIQYLHGDILNLSSIGLKFHHVECVGVLHCLREPVQGWRQIKQALMPGGTFHVGLYSRLARLPVQKIRSEIQNLGLKPTLQDMKILRKLILTDDKFASLRNLLMDRDFFNMSMFRDYLFHTHEHCYTLTEVLELIEATGFEFLGFSLNHEMRKKYLDMFPSDPYLNSFENWCQFEIHYTGSREMFYFWLKNPE